MNSDTAEDLLNIAERLFATEGVVNVPLARIVASSKQRNRSALHYHFGSRADLLKAVLDRRLKEINDLRSSVIEEHAGSGLAGAVRALVEPLGHAVLNKPWGPNYISILAQGGFHPGVLGELVLNEANLSSLRRCRRMIEQALPKIPPAVLASRYRWLTDGAVLAMARWSQEKSNSQRTRETMESLIEQLVVYGVAGLAAPLPFQSAIERQRVNLRIVRG